MTAQARDAKRAKRIIEGHRATEREPAMRTCGTSSLRSMLARCRIFFAHDDIPKMSTIPVKIKHAGKTYDVQADLSKPGLAFKQSVFELTGVRECCSCLALIEE